MLENAIDAKLWQSKCGLWNQEASKFKGFGFGMGFALEKGMKSKTGPLLDKLYAIDGWITYPLMLAIKPSSWFKNEAKRNMGGLSSKGPKERNGTKMKELIIKEFTFIELAVVGAIGYLIGVALVTVIFLIGLGEWQWK